MSSRNLLLTAILITITLAGAGEAAPGAEVIDPAGVERLLDASGGTATIRHHRLTGAVRFARFVPGSLAPAAPPGATLEEQAKVFFNEYGGIFGLSDFELELEPAGRSTDHHGFTHLTYRQIYRGVPVFAGVLLVHFDPAGRLTVVNGTFLPRLAVDVHPAWSRHRAAEIAVGVVEAQQRQRAGRPAAGGQTLTAEAGTLYVFRAGLAQGIQGRVHLIWEIEVVSAGPGVREFVYVDAHSGKVVDQITGIHDALDREVYQGNLGSLVWEEGDPDPIPGGWAGGTAVQVEDWQDEIDGAKETYHLFRHLTNGNWLSFDGADSTLQTVNLGTNCGNAWWDSTATNFCNGVTSDDIVTHEWGHAYTEYTHDLIYQWQPGALNEAYSDIWGETVDLLNGRGTDTPGGPRSDGTCSDFGSGFPKGDNTYRWLAGEDANEPGGFGGAIRDLWRPRCYNDPGKVSDGQYSCGPGDSGGVHTNSGVPNHAFALLVDGGTYNGQTIAAIGLTKATNLFWRAGSVYQVPTTDFVDHADALETSCADLIGLTLYEPKTDDTAPGASVEVIAAADCAEMSKAIAAVELRTEPSQCGFIPLLDPDAPALCVDAGSPVTHSLTDWESGLGGWTAGTRAVANPATFDTPDWAVVGDLPDERSGQAVFVIDDPALGDCASDDESGVLYLESPVIDIPAGTGVPRIALDHWVATEDGWDGGNLKIRIVGGEGETCPNELVLTNDSLSGSQVFTADVSISAGPDLVISGDAVEFVAGEHITFIESVAVGGSFTARIEQDPCWTMVPSSAFTFNAYPARLASSGQGNTNPMAGEWSFTGSDGGQVTGSWVQSQVDLAGLAAPGDSIQLRLEMGLDGCNGLVGWYVDEFEVYACSSP